MRPGFTLRKKRSAHLTIAAAALALPVCAVSLTTASAIADRSTDASAPGDGTSLSLRVTPRHPQYNQPVSVAGSVPASAAGQTIALQAAFDRGEAWRNLTTGRVGRQGSFRLRISMARSSLIRVVPVAPSGPVLTALRSSAATSPAPASAPHRVKVAALFRVSQRSRDILGSRPLRIRGRLLPGIPGRTVRLQARSGHVWRTVDTSQTASAGQFALRARPASGLQRRLRVLFGGDANNARSVSPAGRVTVYGESVASWYVDGGATACGFHAGNGVANRSLPCGTKVRFRYGERSVTAVVDDRGPFVGGRDWDLNQNTAAALGFGGVGTVWSSL